MESFKTVARLFKLGRADAMLAQPVTWPMILRREGLSDAVSVLAWAPQDRITAGLVLSRSRIADPAKQRLRVALQAMLRDGSVDAIFRRYVEEATARSLRIDPTAMNERCE